MRAENRRNQPAAEPANTPKQPMCCVFWCREPGVLAIELHGKEHFCCRRHAPFVAAGKLDWYDR